MKQFNTSTLAGTPVAGNVDGYYEYSQFSRPSGIHKIDDYIFVSDRSIGTSIRVLHGGRVQSIRFNNQQEFLQAGGMTSVVLEGQTLLFVADRDHDKIRYVKLPENLTEAWFDGLAKNKVELQTLALPMKLKKPATVLAMSQNRIIIADTGNSRIIRSNIGFNSFSAALQAADVEVLCQIQRPEGLALYERLLLIADSLSHGIYAFNIQTKKLSLFCGGRVGSRDGPADKAEFKGPCAVQAIGNRVYIVERDSSAIREVFDGKVRTISGARGPGYADGIPELAQFNEPRDLLAIQSTYFTKLIICDCRNSCIRELVDTSAFRRAHGVPGDEQNDGTQQNIEEADSCTEIDLESTNVFAQSGLKQQGNDRFMSSDMQNTKLKLKEREKLLKEREILIQKVNTIESELEDVVKEIEQSGVGGDESQNLEEEETLLSSSIYHSQQIQKQENENEEEDEQIISQSKQNIMKKDFSELHAQKSSQKKQKQTNYRIEPYDTLNRLIPSSKANPSQFFQYFSREPYDPDLLLEYLLQFNISGFVAISFGYLNYLKFADVLKQKITVSAGQIRNARALALFRSIVTHQLLNYSPPVIGSMFQEPAQHASCLALAHHNCVKLRIGVGGQCFKLNQNNQFLMDISEMKLGPRNVADLKEAPMWFEVQVVSELEYQKNVSSQVQFTKGLISDSRVHQVSGNAYVWNNKQYSIFFQRFEYHVDVQRLCNAIGIFQQLHIEVWDQFKIKIGIEAGRGTQKRANHDLPRTFALEQCSVAVFV